MNPKVVAEVTTTGNSWSVLMGLADRAHLLEGKDVNARRHDMITQLQGFHCHESGIATKATRMNILAGDFFWHAAAAAS